MMKAVFGSVTKSHQLHVAGTPDMTCHTAHEKRSARAMQAMEVLPGFSGTAIHDHRKPYLQYDNCSHGCLCDAHHLRERKFIHERYEQDWAPRMSRLPVEIYHQVEQAGQQGQDHLDAAVLSAYQARYDTFITDGLEINPPTQRRPGQRGGWQTPAGNLLERLRIFKDRTPGFMYGFKVPSDNNQAERDVRMIKVRQKVSGGFRTFEGAEIFCAIRSYISTACKNGIGVIQAIQDAFQGKPYIPDCFSTAE
ncbi:transposase [Desulfococcaceae bacterium HSG9]|nr:transposase [Desulfococcaceae bacterium HSG9]